MNEKELVLHEERTIIAYRLCEHFICDQPIASSTRLSVDEVFELRQRRSDDYNRRKKINPFYQYQGMEMNESDVSVKYKSGIWTKHHQEGAVRVLKENIQQFRKMYDEETDEGKRVTLIKMLNKMETQLENITEK